MSIGEGCNAAQMIDACPPTLGRDPDLRQLHVGKVELWSAKEISNWPKRALGSARVGRGELLPLLRVQSPASRRKTRFGKTPNATRGDAYAPQSLRRTTIGNLISPFAWLSGTRLTPMRQRADLRRISFQAPVSFRAGAVHTSRGQIPENDVHSKIPPGDACFIGCQRASDHKSARSPAERNARGPASVPSRAARRFPLCP